MHICHPRLATQALRPVAPPPLLYDLLQLPGLLCERLGIGWLFNMGGPMSRRRTERIHSTLLDNTRSGIQWPRQELVVLHFPPGVSPVEYVEKVLATSGFSTPDGALKHYRDLPAGMHYCHTVTLDKQARQQASPQTDGAFLRAALILGLCGPNFYSPDRTAIWTEARLTRAVGLYHIGGFYED